MQEVNRAEIVVTDLARGTSFIFDCPLCTLLFTYMNVIRPRLVQILNNYDCKCAPFVLPVFSPDMSIAVYLLIGRITCWILLTKAY